MSRGILHLMNQNKYQTSSNMPLFTELSHESNHNSHTNNYSLLLMAKSEFSPPTNIMTTTNSSPTIIRRKFPNSSNIHDFPDNFFVHKSSEINNNNFSETNPDESFIYKSSETNPNESVIHKLKSELSKSSVFLNQPSSAENSFNKSFQNDSGSNLSIDDESDSDDSDFNIDDLELGTAESICCNDTSVPEPKVTSQEYSYEFQRIFDMISLRRNSAQKNGAIDPYIRIIPHCGKYIAAYSKGLPHNQKGFVDQKEITKLITAIRERNSSKLSQIKLGGKLKLLNPSAAWGQDLFGPNNNSYRYSKPPSLSSKKMAIQMVKLYCMNLCRDIPFNKYRTNTVVANCIQYLNKINPDFKHNCYNIFRGPTSDDSLGIYISQFLYRDINFGGYIQKQKYKTFAEASNYLDTWETALEAQNGIIIDKNNIYRETPRYIINGRDLACYVKENGVRAFNHTCLILIDMKAPMNPGIKLSSVEKYYIELGLVDILNTLSMISRNALLACWYAKWNILFLRPEAYGIEVERVFKTKRNKYGISPLLLKNPILNDIKSKFGTRLLSQVYAEGCPTCPSIPSEQGVIAGACATVLKFFFDVRYELDVYEPNIEGDNLMNTNMKTTVGQELEKLTFNISIGPPWSGSNYYMSAISGIKLGEKVALSCLAEIIKKYQVPMRVSITRFNRKTIVLSN